MNPNLWKYIAICAIGALTGGATLTGVGGNYMTRKDVLEAIDQHPAIVGIQYELRRMSKSLEYIEGEMRNNQRVPR